ncbi:hypothetical protein Q7P37_003798 [Cladosporium fusiforme]
MLRAPLLRRRAVWPIWSSREASLRARSHGAHRAQQLSSQPKGRGRNGQSTTKNGKSTSNKPKEPESKTPSLIEQLFPEEHKRYEEAQAKQHREIPRLPLDTAPVREMTAADRLAAGVDSSASESPRAFRTRKMMEMEAKANSQTSVLVLLNASKNLTMEDFTRLIPQGKHVEGWTLEQGDILKVIPGRNLATLEQENFYYLLFSSPLSAFAYQGHATRVARLAAEQTPGALHNALAPAPGYMVNGMDVHAAIQSYTLTSAGQTLNLRQLKPPLSPLLEALIRNGGYSAVTKRPDKMPYEVRLTLEGPQLPMSRIRSVVFDSSRRRALEWSGGDEVNIHITKYEPRIEQRVSEDSETASRLGRTEQTQLQLDMNRSQVSTGHSVDREDAQKRRTVNSVYIAGFHTEHAAQSFVRHWHRRPVSIGGRAADEEGDLPPIANAELLW